jgi:hypothetical protein
MRRVVLTQLKPCFVQSQVYTHALLSDSPVRGTFDRIGDMHNQRPRTDKLDLAFCFFALNQEKAIPIEQNRAICR